MTSKCSKLKDDTYFCVFSLFPENPETSQRELARVAGVSVGGMHFALCALVDRGLVKFTNFAATGGKRRYPYVSPPKGIARKEALTRRFWYEKINEFEALSNDIKALGSDIRRRLPKCQALLNTTT